MMGRPRGPGGSFWPLIFLCFCLDFLANQRVTMTMRTTMMVEDMLGSLCLPIGFGW